jgi:hypothetical protein
MQREDRVGQVASTFCCYMKQYNATIEEATTRFNTVHNKICYMLIIILQIFRNDKPN